MESFNLYKGYGQLNHLEDQPPTKPHIPKKPLITTISIISLILLSLLLLSTIALLIHHSNSESPQDELSENNLSSLNSAIQLVCNVTRYPNSCISILTSSLPTRSKPDPETLFSLSVNAAVRELESLNSLPDSVSSRLGDSRDRSALQDCRDLLADAIDRVNRSYSVAKEGHVAVKSGDLNTWISAAMTDLETCVDGLEEVGVGSTVVEEVKAKVQGSKVCLSNSLAILVNMKDLVEKFRRGSLSGKGT